MCDGSLFRAPLMRTLGLAALFLLSMAPASGATLRLGSRDAADLTSFPLAGKPERFLSESEADFSQEPNGWTWVSDVEHMAWIETDESFLADPPFRYYLAGDRIPAGRRFELFPYHYYDRKEWERFGKKPLHYRLAARNETTRPVTLTVTGAGTTTDWEHWKAWDPALRGEGGTTVTLAPGESHTFWEARGLQPGLPWSAIVLGQADGDLHVFDYVYLQEKDPGLEELRPMPDLAWPPYLLASFSRGSVGWNAARIELLTRSRDSQGRIPVSVLAGAVQSVAFGASPGGPITDLCHYAVVAPTFAEDMVDVKDPVTSWSHVFFGGNYPIRYRLRLPLLNDTGSTATVRLWLASNDRFGVDTLAGLWTADAGRPEGSEASDPMSWARVPALPRRERWRAVSVTLAPGEHWETRFVIVPLGSRWGGLVASLEADNQ